jgi:hypothetical protein
MLATLLPLHSLTRAGMGVLIMYNPGKVETRVSLAARGSTADLAEGRQSGGAGELAW